MPVTYTCDRCGSTCPIHNGDLYPKRGKKISYFADGTRYICETCFTDYIRFFNNWWNLPKKTKEAKFEEIGLLVPDPQTEIHHLSEEYGVTYVG